MDVQVNAFEWLEAEQAKLDAQLAGLDTQLGRRRAEGARARVYQSNST